MFKPCLILLLFLSLSALCFNANAQVKKIFLDENDSPTNDSLKAQSYILYAKVPGDSAWETRQYNMLDTLLATGSYKDEKLTIMHGRFVFYQFFPGGGSLVTLRENGKTDKSTGKDLYYIYSKGYYLNGRREGRWIFNYNTGNTQFVNTFHDDKKNGPYQQFTNEGKLFADGNYENDLKTGHWYMYSAAGDTVQDAIYAKGKLVKVVDRKTKNSNLNEFKQGYADYNFYDAVRRRLSNVALNINQETKVEYSFVLNKDGLLTKPTVKISFNKDIDDQIIHAIMASPKWKPALLDKKPAESNVNIWFTLLPSNDKLLEFNLGSVYQ